MLIIEQYDRYFNLTDNIICVNAIGSTVQHRLNGCDYDSDVMLISDNNVLSQAALRDYGSGDEMNFAFTEGTKLYGMLKKNPFEADYDPDGIRKELYKMFGVNK